MTNLKMLIKAKAFICSKKLDIFVVLLYNISLSIFKQAEIAFELRHETKGRVPLKTVPTQEALAMAVAAQRINGAYIKDTRRFSEVENKTQFANKEIVKFALKARVCTN